MALAEPVVTTPPAAMAVMAATEEPALLAMVVPLGATVAPEAWVDSVAVMAARVVTAGWVAPAGQVAQAGLEAPAAPGESAETALPHRSRELSGVAQRSVHHHRAVVAEVERLATALPARVLHRRLRQRTLKHRTSASTRSQSLLPRRSLGSLPQRERLLVGRRSLLPVRASRPVLLWASPLVVLPQRL